MRDDEREATFLKTFTEYFTETFVTLKVLETFDPALY